MGFIQLPAGVGNFNIVTISLWFRFTEGSKTAAEAKYSEFNDGGDYWYGILPLLTWGEQSTASRTGIGATDHGYPPAGYRPDAPIITYGIVPLDEVPQGCGYIGLRCGDPDNDGGARLETYIPTNKTASGSGLIFAATSYELVPDPGGETGEVQYSEGDLSAIEESYNDWFGSESFSGPDVTPDTWHHLLISWDLSGGSATLGEGFVTASSIMYAALDGVNLTGTDLPMFWAGSGDNSHVSYVTANYKDNEGAAVSLFLADTDTAPLSIPAPATVDVVGSGGTVPDEPVLNCMIAEAQIFTGICLDTSVGGHVSAFRTGDGKPASPSLAAALMGKSPEVYFHTVNQWQNGINQGTAADFTPTGTIASFTPGPDV